MRHVMACLLAAGLVAGMGARAAEAGQYAETRIGTSVPHWVDMMASVNSTSDVAWSALSPARNDSQAQFYSPEQGPQPILVLPAETSNTSRAVGLTDRDASGDVWVVGAASTDAKLLDSRAIAWKLDPNGVGEQLILEQVELSEASFNVGAVAQSYATSILAIGDGAHFVVGSARKQVSRDSLPKPMLWRFTEGSNGVVTINDTQELPLRSALGNGVVTGIAQGAAANTIWACGNTAEPQEYATATCWNVDRNATGGQKPLFVFQEAHVLQSLPSGVATSMVSRVRTLAIGSNGALETVVVGSAMTDEPTPRWFGWVYNLSTKAFWSDLGLVQGAESMASDVAAIAYVEEGGAAASSHGMIVGGVSATVASTSGILGDNPVNVNTMALRGAEHRVLFHGVSDAGLTCNVNEESESDDGPFQHLVSLSANGHYRLAAQGSSLHVLTVFPRSQVAKIHIRDTIVRQRANQQRVDGPAGGGPLAPVPIRYHEAEVASLDAMAVLRVSSALGCGAVDAGTGLGACLGGTTAGFDIGNAHELLLMPVSGSPGKLRSARETSVPFDFSQSMYAQVAQRDSQSVCTISPVMAAETFVNPQVDFNGVVWGRCDPSSTLPNYYTDLQSSYDHCGECWKTAEDGEFCTTNFCSGGQPARDAEISPGSCLIDDKCYHDRALRPEAGYKNPCQRCVPTNSKWLWTRSTNTQCCTGAGEPILDTWDNNGSGEGLDKNGGQTVGAVTWGKNFDENSHWSGTRGTGGRFCESDLNRINGAMFSPGVDEQDWYAHRYSGTWNNGWLEPRADLLVGGSNEKSMELCVFVQCDDGATTTIAWAGTTGVPNGSFSCDDRNGLGCVSRRAAGSPAANARGLCATTSASSTKASVELTYECSHGSTRVRKDATMFVSVRPLTMDTEKTCQDYRYNLRIGNDVNKACGPLGGSCLAWADSTSTCTTCCD